MSRTCRLLLLTLFPPFAIAQAQRPSVPSPDSVASAFFSALAREQWLSAAHLLDLEQFRPIVSRTVALVRQYGPPRPPTIEDLMRDDPDMPREVAEYQLRKYREYAGQEDPNPLPHQFAGVTTVDALAALPLDRAAAAWLEAQDDRTRIRELFTRNRCPVPSRDSLAVLERHTVLGVLIVGDGGAFALHRSGGLRREQDDSLPGEPPEVLELHRRNGAWLVVPREDLLRPLDPSLAEVSCERPPARRIRP